ncbi:MAG TPA: nuclease-related domain-containing protein [Thermomicrobiales bacterium]|nr:nuclease-related domain-containing protein [Thermomicrobiales bacterium]
MRVVRNVGYIKRRKRAAQIMTGLGLLMLLLSWAVYLLQPDIFLFAMVGLALGFILFNGGMQQMSRWARRPRSDIVIDHELKSLNDRFTLIHYPDLPGRRPDHVLIGPSGVLVMTTREAHGQISVKGTRWRSRRSPLLSLFSMGGPQLGNPSIENEEQVKTVREFLTSQDVNVEPEGAVVFVADNVEVDIEDTPITILHATEIRHHLQETDAAVTVGGRERDQIAELLSRGEDLERSADKVTRPKKRVRAA